MLADLILALHFAFVVFVIAGALLILAGRLRRWHWTGNPVFRFAHLAAVLFVAIETLLGLACPLTVWEAALRGDAHDQRGFIAHWLGALLYYDWPAWVFTALYVSFAGLVALLYLWAPPQYHRHPPRGAHQQ